MKKLLLLILNFCFVAAVAQNLIAPITISLPPNPPANTADWATAMPPVMIMAQTKMQNGSIPYQASEGTMLVTIKSGGSNICGTYNQQTAPASNFSSTTKTWSGAAVLNLLGKDCILKPGSYELCVQFYTRDPATGRQSVTGEACKSFTIADTKQQSYSPPQNVMPPDGKVFSDKDAMQPVMFRWTPVLPRPHDPLIYRVKIYEAEPGRTKAEILKANMPLDIIEVKDQTQTAYKLSKRITGLYWEVEAESAERVQGEKPQYFGKSEATSVSFKSGNEDPVKYSPPVNQLPVDGKVFTKEEASQPINLRWTPVLPRPKDPVNYRVTIKQIEKGQTAAQAMKANKAIDVLEVKNETQTTYKLAQRPNGIGYVWNVEASKKPAMGDIEMLGTSEATAFSVAGTCGIELLNVKIDCDAIINGKQQYKICMDIKNLSDQNLIFNNPGNNASTNSLINASFVGAITGINTTGNFPFAPTVGTITGATFPNVLTVGSITNFCFYYTPPGPGTYYFAATAKPQTNNLCTAWDSIPLVIPICRCNLCDNITFNLGQETTQFNPWSTSTFPFPLWFGDNNHLYITQPLVVGPASIKVLQVKAEVADFYWYTEKEDCKKCDNNSYYWGNLISGNTNSAGFNPSGTSGTDDAGVPLPNSHEMQFISSTATGATFNGNIRLQMSVPPQTELSCCTDCFRFCIRYTIVFLENGVCKTCTKVKCYEVKRQHRPGIYQLYPPPNECGDRGVIIHGGGGLLQAQPKKN